MPGTRKLYTGRYWPKCGLQLAEVLAPLGSGDWDQCRNGHGWRWRHTADGGGLFTAMERDY